MLTVFNAPVQFDPFQTLAVLNLSLPNRSISLFQIIQGEDDQ